MALLDFLRTALPSNTAEVNAFNTGANQYMNRRRLSEENQLMQRKEDARLKKMNIGLQPFQSKDPFGPEIDMPLYTVPEVQNDTGGVVPSPKQKPIPPKQDGPLIDVMPDGTQIEKGDGGLEGSDDVPVDEPTLLYPKVDESKVDLPPKLGGQYDVERNKEVQRRRKITSDVMDALKQNQTGFLFSDVRKFYTSKEFLDFIYQHPQYLDEIREDPEGFMTRYQGDAKGRATSKVIPESTDRTNDIIRNRKKDIAGGILYQKNSKRIVDLANDMGVDPIAALSIFALESDFGRTKGASSAGAIGGMQVMPDQFQRLKKWFADPANRSQVNNAYTLGDPPQVNTAQVEYILKKINSAKVGSSEGQLTMGMAQLIYNKAIGLDKSLWGAGYQGNANDVLKAESPLPYDDGYITNSDYNRAYVDIYNNIISTQGKKLLDTYGTLSNIDLANIQGTGVGKPVLKQVEGIERPVIDRAAVPTGGGGGGGITTKPDGTVVDNSGRTMDVDPKGVTDQKPGVKKEDGAAGSSLKGNTPEQITSPITELAKNPDALGFELQRAIQLRNTMAQFAEIDRSSGLTDTPEYKQQIIDLQIMDTNLYVMQAYDSLNKFSFSGNPAKLNSVLNAFTGGSVLVQPRSDGLFNFVRPDGTPIEGATGLTSQAVQTQAMQIFDSKYKDAVTAAATERAKFKFEKKVENDLQIELERAKTNFEMIKKAAEQLGYQITKLGEDSFAVSQGQYTQTYTLQEVEQKIPDSDETEIVKKYVPGEVMQFGFGVGPQDYLNKLVK